MNYVDALDLPFWIRWAGVVYAYVLAGVVTLLVCWPMAWLAARPVLKSRDRHWTELARQVYPARKTMVLLAIICPATMVLMLWAREVPLFAGISRFSFMFWGGLLSFAVAVGVMLHFRRRLSLAPSPLGYWAKGVAAYLVLMGKHVIILLLLLIALPCEVNRTALVMMLAAMGLMTVLLFSDDSKFLSAMGLCRPAGERLRRIVADVSHEMNHDPPPRAFEITSPFANAFALPVRKMTGTSDSALALLTDNELRAVFVHELAHLEEPRSALAVRIAVQFLIISFACCKPAIGQYGLYGIMVGLVPLSILIQLGTFSRRMEARADARAVSLPGVAEHYARGLEKLHIKSLIPAVMPGKGGSHPHLYDRMLAAGVQPDYPRPAPPGKRHKVRIWAAIGFVALTMWYSGKSMDEYLHARAKSFGPTMLLFAASLTGETWPLSWIAEDKSDAGDGKAALNYFLAAAQLDPEDAYYAGRASYLFSSLGNCGQARKWLAEANSRLGEHSDDRDEDNEALAAIEDAATALSSCHGPDEERAEPFHPVSE